MQQVLRLGRRTVALATFLALVPWAAALADPTPGVTPKEVNVSLAPGEQTHVTKTVHTPPIVPKPDIYFLADTTGSMSGAINNVKSNASTIISTVDGSANDPRYGAGEYRDFPIPLSSSFAFKNDAPIGTAAAAQTAIAGWSANEGRDTPEANLFALHKLITDAGFRPDSTPIVVWFGDAPGHDPVCKAISGEANDVTEVSVTAELVGRGVRVIAVSTTTGPPAGLNADPGPAGDYAAACGTVTNGTAGQADRIAKATGGASFKDVPPDEVSKAILDGLTNLPVVVTPKATCDTGLELSFVPTSQTVTSGDDAVFDETVKLTPSAPTGDLHCTVKFLLDGKLLSDDFVQKVNRVNRPPDCSKLALDKTSLWPPNHKFVTVTVSGATDPDADPLTTKVTGVTQDEPLNGLGDGDTSPDAATVAGHPNQVQLRAERSGTGDGRVYKVAVTVSDGHLTCSRTLTVGVPHDQSGPPAVDSSPPSYNSFGP